VHIVIDEVTQVDTASLKPNPKNPNKHTLQQIDRLAKIIQYQGFRQPIVVSNQSGFVIVGHGRLEAAKALGLDVVPVSYQDFIDSDQEYAFMVADNAIASWAELDLSQINTDLADFSPDFDLDQLGLDGFVLEPAEKFEAQCDDDALPENVDTRTKPGDVWLLGSHRLMCGDSTSIDAVEKLMEGEKADMVFTDPPYGMRLNADYSSMNGTGKKHRNIAGDHDDFTPELISAVFAVAPEAKEIFMWGADYYSEHLQNRNSGSWIVWDKRSNEDEIGKMDGQFGSAFELCWSAKRHKRDIIRLARPTSFWRGDEASVHPSQKPISVIEWFMERYGQPTVLDLFGGSGSTLIACEKTNRRCFMMELDPQYCDIIISRWEKYTGGQAVRAESNS
jgi:DNA modification methylase